MKLIVGLGNPGGKYKNTRHNIGFSVLDEFAKSESLDWQTEKNFQFSIFNFQFALAKPRIFMNESGKAVKELVKKYAVKTHDLLMIHDDLDISLGSFKLQFGKGPKQHNGVTSVENHLGSKDFWRLRVGIDNRSKINPSTVLRAGYQRSKLLGEDYVLAKFTSEELKSLKILMETELIPAVKNWLQPHGQ